MKPYFSSILSCSADPGADRQGKGFGIIFSVWAPANTQDSKIGYKRFNIRRIACPE